RRRAAAPRGFISRDGRRGGTHQRPLDRGHRPARARAPPARGGTARHRAPRRRRPSVPPRVAVARARCRAPRARRRRGPSSRLVARRQGALPGAALPQSAAPGGLRPPAGPLAVGRLRRDVRRPGREARRRDQACRQGQGGSGARVPAGGPVPRADAGVRGRRFHGRARLRDGQPSARPFGEGGTGADGGAPAAPGCPRRTRLVGAGRGGARRMSSLDLALVGNGTIGVLVNPLSEVVWGCFPRFDGDPSFCSLLRERTRDSDFGFFVVELGDVARAEQEYLVNTPVLVTRLYDRAGAGVEITDFAPRFHQYGRLFSPMLLVRQIRRIAGNPRIPFEWQDAVIRSAITLQLNVFEDTGAIVAAMTTSIPEAPGSGRNWDYRHCWLRDAYFVVNALNRLGATRTMERYLGYIVNV